MADGESIKKNMHGSGCRLMGNCSAVLPGEKGTKFWFILTTFHFYLLLRISGEIFACRKPVTKSKRVPCLIFVLWPQGTSHCLHTSNRKDKRRLLVMKTLHLFAILHYILASFCCGRNAKFLT